MKESEVKLLATSGTFQGKKLKGRIEETHISWVILTRRFAFKIKKPIKLAFLDFSTLKARKARCGDEIRLNRRFTDIYQSVVPIRMGDSNLVIGGKKGKVVDYAVRMKRMAVTKRMDKLLQSNRVKNKNIISLAEVISNVHQKCQPVYEAFVLSQAKDLFNDIRGIKPFITKYLGNQYERIIARGMRWSDAFLRAHAEQFQERIESGYKRDVHGDLHSGNIFLYRKPVIFDCIEFNDSFRQIDILYEVAFLCMDMDAFNQRALAKRFLSEYSKRFNCFRTQEDRLIFKYFKCLRANVRAKVHVMSATQAEDVDELKFHLDEAKKYLTLMNVYMSS